MNHTVIPFVSLASGINCPLSNPPNYTLAIPLVTPYPGTVTPDATATVTVHFTPPVGGGDIIILVPLLDGTVKEERFSRTGVSRAITAIFTEKGISLYYADPHLKGDIVIAISEH